MAQETYAAGMQPWMLARGDFDADGNSDLAVANFVNGASVLFGDGRCGFSQWTQVLFDDPLGEYSGGSVAVGAGDLDDDGFDDVVVEASGPYGEISYFGVIWSLGARQFGATDYLQVGTGAADIVVSDLDRDGILDIASAPSWLTLSFGGPLVNVVLGRGARQFAPAAAYPIPSWSDGLGAADLDGDTIVDLVTASGAEFESAWINVNHGAGGGLFKPNLTHDLGANGPTTGIATGDLDGDGLADVCVGLGGANSVALLLSQRPAGFGTPHLVRTGNNPVGYDLWEPYYLALGDLDEDGRLDLAATNFVGNVSILLSNR